jgi:zinc/manganese transport system substrate-binding protein
MRIILKKSTGRLVVIPVVALVALAAGAGCSSSSAGSAGGRVKVVAAENFWGSIAAQIAGNAADVTSIISNPDADPHDYEPTAQDARTLATAGLVIENGIGYDGWAQKLLDANPTSGRAVLDVGKLVGVPNGGNPHQWYSETSVMKVIRAISSELQRIDPKHRADYERNTSAYLSKGLAEYTSLVTQIKNKYAGTPIGASESIVTLLAETTGLKMLTPESFLDAVAEGNEPTAADKATVDAQIRGKQIKVFVFNSQNSTPDVQRLVDAARTAGIPVTTVTETLTPAGATYQAWQARELRALLAALDKASR